MDKSTGPDFNPYGQRRDAAPPKELVEVVAAVRRDGDRYWVCRRSEGRLAGLWEYPGGKVKDGETPRQALHREILEEFGTWSEVQEQIGHPIIASAPGSSTQYRVTFFLVTFSDEPKLTCHDVAKWCTVSQLQQNKYLPSDEEFNRRLVAPPPSDAAPPDEFDHVTPLIPGGTVHTPPPPPTPPIPSPGRRIREGDPEPLNVHPEDAPGGPKIICLCGSSRFVDTMAVIAWNLETEGAITMALHLLPGWYTNQAHHQAEHEGIAERMDALHLRKIDLADEVFVVNVGGYYGDSTAREIQYARDHGKPVRFLEEKITREPPAEVEDAPGGPCSCWKEAENLLAHGRTIEWACSCADHPNSEWCDCPFCVLFRQHWPTPRSAYCPKCGDSLMAEGATKPSACFRCATDYFMGTSPDA